MKVRHDFWLFILGERPLIFSPKMGKVRKGFFLRADGGIKERLDCILDKLNFKNSLAKWAYTDPICVVCLSANN